MDVEEGGSVALPQADTDTTAPPPAAAAPRIAEDKAVPAAPGGSRNATKALPVALRPYIEHISMAICGSFLAIIAFTVFVDIKQGMQS